MADVVTVGCLITFLIINTCYAGIPGLGVLEDGPATGSGADIQLPSVQSRPNKLMMVQQPRYKCHLCEPPECAEYPGDKICSGAIYCFKSSVRDGILRHSRGCFDETAHYQFNCLTNYNPSMKKRHTVQLNITCCRGDMCNDGLFPDLPPATDTAIEPLSSNIWKLWVTVIASVLTLCCIGAMALFVLRRTHRLRVSRAALHKLGAESTYFSSNIYSTQVTSAFIEGSNGVVKAVPAGDSTLREYLESSVTSGSGSGLPLMVQRTLAKQVTLKHCVGKGRYGEVWRGIWCADSVAVKIFFSRDEASWRRETEIYSTVLLRHDNILAYIGSDMTSRNSCTQLWLITHYHPLGSLYDYLNRTVLTRQQMMRICISTVNGLLHLHTEIHGTQGKPGIAHRDIKSKNILMKLDGTCCIADFGLAVTKNHLNTALALNPMQGTKRYMSPELLDNTINVSRLQSFLSCDVYALGLVLWEVHRRACGAPYRVPYQLLAPADPTAVDMRKIVCVDGARPHPHAHVHPTMLGISRLMQECWHQNPSVRLPMLRIKKTLMKLAMQDECIQLNEDNEVAV